MATKRRASDGVRGAQAAHGGLDLGDGVWIIQGAGAPTSGTSGDGAGFAGPGSQYIDRTSGTPYKNTNTAASPTWAAI